MVAKSTLSADAAAFVPRSKLTALGALGASVTANAGPQSTPAIESGHGHFNASDR